MGFNGALGLRPRALPDLLCLVLYGALALVNVAGFLVTRHDKRAARADRRANPRPRVPERVLLALATFGAWPAEALAFARYRHKTRKIGFLVVFWMGAAVGTLAWYGWLSILGCIHDVAFGP